MVHVVGAHHRSGKFLDKIIVLIGDPGRGQRRKFVPLAGGKFLGNQIQGLIPGSFFEGAVFLDSSGRLCYSSNVDITWLGHSCFRIKGNQAVVITDPFGPDLGYDLGKQTANIVTVSHQHPGHNNVEDIGGEPHVIRGPGEYEIAGVLVIGVATYHDAIKGQSRGKNTMYLMEVDGVAV